jgi:TRAP-type C4-dicarboxylate transport system permease small subunit
VGAIGILAMLVHVVAYVVSRHVLSTPIPATVEIVSRYYMITIAFLPLAWADRRGDMISVEIFGDLIRGRLKLFNSLFVVLLSGVTYSALAYTTWFKAMREFGVKSFVVSLNTAIPVWPTYFVLPIAFALAALVCVVKIWLLLTGPNEGHTPKSVPAEEAFRE